MAEKEITPEQRKEAREIALKTLKSKVVDIATVYLVDKSGQYGDKVNSVMHDFKYIPALQGGAINDVILGGLLSSRDDEKYYTGNISEHKILKGCAGILNEALGAVTVQDILSLSGSKETVDAKYANIYISDLAKSEDKETKQVFQNILGLYMQYLTNTKVAEALNSESKQIRGGLEEILCPKEDKKN